MMIEFDQVSKVFATRRGAVRALDDLSLAIDAGQYVAICGPSGCGKSTLLSLVGGLALPTTGRLVVGGLDTSGTSSAERARFRARHIGFVFQVFHLLPFLNVLDNVLLAAAQPGQADTVDLCQVADRPVRTAAATASPAGPVEYWRTPTRGDGPRSAQSPPDPAGGRTHGKPGSGQCRDRLDQIDQFHQQGGTVLLVTHEPPAAARAQATIRLHQGRLA